MITTDVESKLSEAEQRKTMKRSIENENGGLNPQSPAHPKDRLEPTYPDLDDDLFNNVPV
jgi:hypothetical protein